MKFNYLVHLSKDADSIRSDRTWLIFNGQVGQYLIGANSSVVLERLKPIIGLDMEESPPPQHGQEDIVRTVDAEIRFATLLYRFIFFDWLFADVTKAKNLFEQHAAWQHNRKMRIHLPLYLRRWSVLTVLDFGIGCVFENLLETQLVAAWFFTWSCVTVTGMAVIAVLWLFLSNPEMP